MLPQFTEEENRGFQSEVEPRTQWWDQGLNLAFFLLQPSVCFSVDITEHPSQSNQPPCVGSIGSCSHPQYQPRESSLRLCFPSHCDSILPKHFRHQMCGLSTPKINPPALQIPTRCPVIQLDSDTNCLELVSLTNGL